MEVFGLFGILPRTNIEDGIARRKAHIVIWVVLRMQQQEMESPWAWVS
jgi:hypothetical protein